MKTEFDGGLIGGYVKLKAGWQANPIPLKKVSYAVEVLGGLAVVTAERLYRNDEKKPIEATATFPVPFEAAVCSIEASVNGRNLKGEAKAKEEARATYEAAIDSGKPAVLHEELLRGLHMLSVANVAPGAEIVVKTIFTMPVVLEAGSGSLRIPLTLGQIYGEFPLHDSDRPAQHGPVSKVELQVSALRGSATVNGGALKDGRTVVTDDQPVDLTVHGLYEGAPGTLEGLAADGRKVSVSFAEASGSNDADLDADILVDVSGSMREPVEANPEGNGTKWEAAVSGIAAAARSAFRAGDRLSVWTFSTKTRKHFAGDAATLAARVATLPFDNGGTELPGAVSTVANSRSEANVLLITDGKSGLPIDVQGAAARGARFTVVLVGKDSLEANVGYLAAMTGGQMFVATGSESHSAIQAAAASMRSVASPVEPVKGKPIKVGRTVSGVEIVAGWSGRSTKAARRDGHAAAIGAYAAHLAMQGMDRKEAAAFAEAEGLVSHLTSIVLVDEAADAVDGLPAQRKVPLARPMTARAALADMPASAMAMFSSGVPGKELRLLRRSAANSLHASGYEDAASAMWSGAGRGSGQSFGRLDEDGSDFSAPVELPLTPIPKTADPVSIAYVLGKIDWDGNPGSLMAGKTAGLGPMVVATLLQAADADGIRALANALGIAPVQVVIALVAQHEGSSSRTADRIARALLAKADPALLAAALRAVCL